jgi:hypothetical protein
MWNVSPQSLSGFFVIIPFVDPFIEKVLEIGEAFHGSRPTSTTRQNRKRHFTTGLALTVCTKLTFPI